MYCATLYLFFIEMMLGRIGQIGWKSIEIMSDQISPIGWSNWWKSIEITLYACPVKWGGQIEWKTIEITLYACLVELGG